MRRAINTFLSFVFFAGLACAGGPGADTDGTTTDAQAETFGSESWPQETGTSTYGESGTTFAGTETGPITGGEEFCSDGVAQPWEACDEGDPQNDGHYGGCAPDCELGPHCGDGVIDLGWEACDDGNREGGDGCPSDCGVSACGELF